jgi:transcriptional regulator with XRE-family HTH domain
MDQQISDLIDFPTQLKRLRLESGFSQESLSDAAELHHSYISMLERGKRNPSLLTLQKIAGAFEMKTWEFVQAIECS